MTFELPYVTAVVLGSLHAFDADHIAAVTSFAVQKPEPRSAMRFGFRWALGHGFALVLAGTALVAFGLSAPESATGFMERLVGVALVALGALTMWASRRLHAHEHVHDGEQHVHLHSHVISKDHEHSHGPTVMGLLHGLAGAAPAVALVPLAMFDSKVGGLSYLLFFAAGTAAAMSAYAFFAGFLAHRAGRFAASFGRAIGQFTGIGTITIGIIWLIR